MLNQAAQLLSDFLEALKKLNDPRAYVIAVLWLATLTVIVVVLTGCGTLNYTPQEITSTTTTKTQELPHAQATQTEP